MKKRTTRAPGQSSRRLSARRSRPLSDAEVVRRAVAGTLNREVEVEVEKQPPDRWAITLVLQAHRSPVIILERWEWEAMRQVLLVPAHRRGHFLRNYAVLEKQSALGSQG